MNNLEIKCRTLEMSDNWLQSIAETFSSNVDNDCVKLPESFGEGEFRQFFINDWISVYYFKACLTRSIEFHNVGDLNSPFVPVFSFLNDTILSVGDKKYKAGMHSPNGIFIPSSDIDFKWEIPANDWITSVTIAFNKEHMLNDVSTPNSFVFQMLNQNKPFYFFETLNASMYQLIKEIENDISLNHQLQKLKIYNHSFQLLTLYIEQLNKRGDKSNANIYPSDVKTIFEIRKIIMDNICNIPSLNELAAIAAMSSSKLHKSFKQIFGKSITQFALTEKMRLAKSLLNTKSHSVTEVAYKLGYTNVSHFAKAFRNCYEVNPGAYLESIK